MEITGKLSDLMNPEEYDEIFIPYVKDISVKLLTEPNKLLYITSDSELSLCEKAFDFAIEKEVDGVETEFGTGFMITLENSGKAFIEVQNGLYVLSFHEDYLFYINKMFGE